MRRILAVVLFTLAVLYFSFGRNLTLDLTDEGQIVYPSWLVATGAVPNRDFRHMYGPSLFLFNGALFSIFGTDLAVTRWSLVLIKALVATAVFFAARMATSTLCALLAYTICVCVWGTPWWVFNTPYANHYALLLSLSGVLAFWRLRQRFRLACVVAGVCFGLAMTFKTTSGVFALLAFVLFLIWEMPLVSPSRVVSVSVDLSIRAIRMLALLATALIAAAYFVPRNSTWNAAMLFAPLALTVILLAWREIRGHVPAATGYRSVIGIFCAGAGMVLPILGYAAYYRAAGGLSSAIADLLVELPPRFHWFSPLGWPEKRPTLVAIAVLGSLAAVRFVHPAFGKRRILALLAAVAAAWSMAVLARETLASPGVRAYALMMFWHRDFLPLAYVIPFAVVWATLPSLVTDSGQQGVPTGVGLLYFFAVTSLLLLYPAADFWHFIMGLPAFLPLLAFQFHRIAVPFRGVRGAAAATLIFAATFAFGGAFVDTLRFSIRSQPVPPPSMLARASGVSGASAKFANTVELMTYLDAQPKDVPLFTLANQQMMYFLAGRTSAADPDEFILYLVASDVIDDADARTLLPPARLIERLQASKPWIIDDSEGALADRFRHVFPEVSAFVAEHYRPAHTAGTLRVLRWTDA